jgi:hypothetical protein
MSMEPDRVGLCARCTHAKTVTTPRSTFWRCMLSDVDPRFDRYPRLPVLACAGFTPGDPPRRHRGDKA